MKNYKIVGYLLTYRYPEYSGLTHLDRFDTLAKAEDYAESSELTEYVINPIVDLSGDQTMTTILKKEEILYDCTKREQTMQSNDLVLYLGGSAFGVLFAVLIFLGV